MLMKIQLVYQWVRQAKQESDAWIAVGHQMTHWPQPLSWRLGLTRYVAQGRRYLNTPKKTDHWLSRPGQL